MFPVPEFGFFLFVFPCSLERLGVLLLFLQREKDGLDTLRIVGVFLFFFSVFAFTILLGGLHWWLISLMEEWSK